MKLIFETEDCIVGIIFGLLLISLSGRYFAFSFAKNILYVIIPIYLIIIVLDIMHEMSNLTRHFIFVGSALLHNIFDIILGVALYAHFLSFSVPLIGEYIPLLADANVLFWLGAFEVVSHIIWLVLTPFNQ